MKYKTLPDIIFSLMLTKKEKDLEVIISDNKNIFDEYPMLMSLAESTKKRIKRIEKEKRKSWRHLLN